jgi:hypothetical protein
MSEPQVTDTRVRCVFIRGPFDNHVEMREKAPEVGEAVYRLWRGHYVKYVWSGAAFWFEG